MYFYFVFIHMHFIFSVILSFCMVPLFWRRPVLHVDICHFLFVKLGIFWMEAVACELVAPRSSSSLLVKLSASVLSITLREEEWPKWWNPFVVNKREQWYVLLVFCQFDFVHVLLFWCLSAYDSAFVFVCLLLVLRCFNVCMCMNEVCK